MTSSGRAIRLAAGRRVAIVGLGTMGRTIADGLVTSGVPKRGLAGVVRMAGQASKLRAATGLAVSSDLEATVGGSDLVLLALKPPRTLEVAARLGEAGLGVRGRLFVSIAAGVSTAQLERRLGGRSVVVRAMPNTPCRVGSGLTVLSPGRRANSRHLSAARKLFEPLGRVLELEEKHMDTVTGLSASGPAFIYVILEALADGGVARGLPRDVALEMAAQMVYGAADMVRTTGRHPASLKDDVTTPAGCTIAGILALEDGKIRSVLSRAVEIAATRAGELGSEE